MKGRFYIDGKDSYSEWGITIQQGGYAQVIQLPSFKKIDSTEWEEYDGEEMDLSSCVLDSRTLTLPLNIKDIGDAYSFFTYLKQEKVSNHTFLFDEINKTYTLRLTQNTSFSQMIQLGKMNITLSEDNPSMPSIKEDIDRSSEIWQRELSFDSADLSEYGIWVLKGTSDSIRKQANVRENLKIDNSIKKGIIYDDEGGVRYKTKDVTLKLLIHCKDITEFWLRYNTLFSLLLQNEERTMVYDYRSYKCYYKSMTVSKFRILPSGRIWCEFNVILTVINGNGTSSNGGGNQLMLVNGVYLRMIGRYLKIL